MTAEQISAITQDVSKHVGAAEPVKWETLPLAEARKQGAMMLFGEKYPDPVRMVSMGSFSKELCGGTHLDNTAEVEAFEVLSEEGVSAGTRRIVALTGPQATQYTEQICEAVRSAAETIGCAQLALAVNVSDLLEKQRELKKLLTSGGVLPNADAGGMATNASVGGAPPLPGKRDSHPSSQNVVSRSSGCPRAGDRSL